MKKSGRHVTVASAISGYDAEAGKMKTRTLYGITMFWELFIGTGAVAGAMMMFMDPTGRMLGMDHMLPLFQPLPFSDRLFGNFLFPGAALLLCNGVTNTVALLLLLRRNRFASRAAMACGVILMLWTGVQFYIFPFNFMSTAYFIFGASETLAALLLYRREKSGGVY